MTEEKESTSDENGESGCGKRVVGKVGGSDRNERDGE